jgi:hypothetical protein
MVAAGFSAKSSRFVDLKTQASQNSVGILGRELDWPLADRQSNHLLYGK